MLQNENMVCDNDTILIPADHFEQLFADALGGVLGVIILYNKGNGGIYTSCAPHSEGSQTVYLPSYLLEIVGSDAEVNVVRADLLPEATGIVARLVDEADVDVRELLEERLYDFRFINANTVLTLGSLSVIIETIYAGDESVSAARLGAEVALVIEEPLVPKPEPATIKEIVPAPLAVADLRNKRAAYYDALFQRK